MTPALGMTTGWTVPEACGLRGVRALPSQPATPAQLTQQGGQRAQTQPLASRIFASPAPARSPGPEQFKGPAAFPGRVGGSWRPQDVEQSCFLGLEPGPLPTLHGPVQPPGWRGDSRAGWTVWLSPVPFSGPFPFGPSNQLLPLSKDPWILQQLNMFQRNGEALLGARCCTGHISGSYLVKSS